MLREGIPKVELIANEVQFVKDKNKNLVRSYPYVEIVNPSVFAFVCINVMIFHFMTLNIRDDILNIALKEGITVDSPRISSHLFVLFLNQILSMMVVPQADISNYKDLIKGLNCIRMFSTTSTKAKDFKYNNTEDLTIHGINKMFNNIKTRGKSDIHTRAREDFDSILFMFIIVLCREHPIITLPKVVSLTNIADIPDSYKTVASINIDLMKAAKFLVDFMKRDPELENYTKLYENVSNYYIRLATDTIPSHQTTHQQSQSVTKQYLDKGTRIFKIMNKYFEGCNCPVLTIEISPKRAIYERGLLKVNKQYAGRNVEVISRFSETLGQLGGINGSKRVRIYTSTGNVHDECLKRGRDDLRQSDILMSLFNIINSVFNTSDRLQTPLFMRTYSICPFSPTVGTLGMFKNTISFQTYLSWNDIKKARAITGIVDKPESESLGGLSAYYKHMTPGMLTPEHFFHIMASEQKNSIEDGKRAFVDNIGKFPPVFRHFFTENFVNTLNYFGNMRRYTKATAISSAVTELFGIGDRHSDNILIDALNCDVMHIDLEIAFDAGKTIRIPEMCPFRLTQNVVDGFGVNGLAGTFLSLMEFAYTKMRSEKEIIISYCEVLLSDPLYKWNIPLKIDRESSTRHGGGNGRKRAILSIRNKLKGKVGPATLAPLQYAEQRIAEAISDDNLGRMFVGWRPFF